MLKYDYVDFNPETFDFSYCDTVPFRHQLEEHPIADSSQVETLNAHLTDWEKSIIIDQSGYFIYDTFNKKRVSEQSDSLISIEDCPFSTAVHGNSIDLIKKYLKTYQGAFTFLLGNNEYRPYSDRLFKHTHESTEINGNVYKDTFTVLYPVKIVEDITTTFKVFFSEYEGLNGIDSFKAPQYIPEKGVCSLDFPDTGKALLIHFNSANGIHWAEGFNNNNFLCHSFDCVTMREELC